jgi:hypothetical protein
VRKKNVKRCKTLSFIGIVGDEGIDDEGGWLEGSPSGLPECDDRPR